MLVGRHARSLAKIPSGTEIAAIVSCANLMRAAHSLFRFVSGLFELRQDVPGIRITFLRDWRKRYWSPVSDEIKLRSDKPLTCQSSKYLMLCLYAIEEKSRMPPNLISKDQRRGRPAT